MKHPTLLLSLCWILALVAGPAPASAQEAQPPPKEPRDASALAPTATPAQPAPSARGRQSGGVSRPVQIALILASAALGALIVASIPRRARTSEPAPSAMPLLVPERAPPANGASPREPARAPEPEPATKAGPAEDAVKPARRAKRAPQREPASETAPAPKPQPAALEQNAEPVAAPSAETCRIELHNHPGQAHFYAVPDAGGHPIARSPYFDLRRSKGAQGSTAADALKALVDDLAQAGWLPVAAGQTPWDVQFERTVEAQEPGAPERSG